MTYSAQITAEQRARRLYPNGCDCTIYGGSTDYPCNFCKQLNTELERQYEQIQDR